MVTEPEIARLAGGHEAHRAAQAAILEAIAHAMLLALHSLHCRDKCPMGRSSPWPVSPLPQARCHPWSTNPMVGVAAIRDCRLIHDRIHPMVRCRAAAADFRIDDRALRSVGRSLLIDLGCGPGRDLRYFRSLGHDVVGLDGSTEFVAMARSYSECEGSPTEFPRDEITEEPLRWHLCERIAEAFLVVSSRV